MGWNRYHLFFAVVYMALLLLVGVLAGRRKRDANQFLNATGALPLGVCIAAAIAANCGSLDVIAMMALGAQYGMLACHFYWIGAVPALLVLVFWLLPAYAQGRYQSLLDYIAHFYGREMRSLVALCMATMMLLLAGVCLYAVAQLVMTFLGWSFLQGVLATAPVVLFYTWLGGFRATVYTELLHFAAVLIAVVPLLFLVLHDFGGLALLHAHIPVDRAHLWQTLPWIAPHATMDRFGLVFGLGIVLSFGYWSTDFVQLQRALAVRRAQDVQYVPLAQSAAKVLFAFLIVLPGVAAPLVLKGNEAGNWNATLPSMMLHYYSPFWAALGVLGLAACLVATFANNVSGFSSAWMQGIYRPWIRPQATESHYLWMSRMTNAGAVVLSIGAAYVALRYQSLMDYVQMIFSTFNAPLFAVVALAALAPGRVTKGGLGGFTLGLISTVAHQMLVYAGLLHYGSQMSANFYGAILGFVCALCATLLLGNLRRETVPFATRKARTPLRFSLPVVLLALGIAFACGAINWYFR
jgi:SSS family solute:Na+ symporter